MDFRKFKYTMGEVVFSGAFISRLERGEEVSVEQFMRTNAPSTKYWTVVGVDPSGTVSDPEQIYHQSFEGVSTFVVALANQSLPRVRLVHTWDFECIWQPRDAVVEIDRYLGRLRLLLRESGVLPDDQPIIVVIENTYSQAASRYFATARTMGLWQRTLFAQLDNRPTQIPVGINPTRNSFCEWAELLMSSFSDANNPCELRSIANDWTGLIAQLRSYRRHRTAEVRHCTSKPNRDDMVQSVLFTLHFIVSCFVLRSPYASDQLVAHWVAQNAQWLRSLNELPQQQVIHMPPPAPGDRGSVITYQVPGRVAHLLHFFSQSSNYVSRLADRIRERIDVLIERRRPLPPGFTAQLTSRVCVESWKHLAQERGIDVRSPSVIKITRHARVHPLSHNTIYREHPYPPNDDQESIGAREYGRCRAAVRRCEAEWNDPDTIDEFSVDNMGAYVALRTVLRNLRSMQRLVDCLVCLVPCEAFSDDRMWAIKFSSRRTFDWEELARRHNLLDVDRAARRIHYYAIRKV